MSYLRIFSSQSEYDSANMPKGSVGLIKDGEEKIVWWQEPELIENKAMLRKGDTEWIIEFDYPINSWLTIMFNDGSWTTCSKGIDSKAVGTPSFEDIGIINIDPSSDDKYIYTF